MHVAGGPPDNLPRAQLPPGCQRASAQPGAKQTGAAVPRCPSCGLRQVGGWQQPVTGYLGGHKGPGIQDQEDPARPHPRNTPYTGLQCNEGSAHKDTDTPKEKTVTARPLQTQAPPQVVHSHSRPAADFGSLEVMGWAAVSGSERVGVGAAVREHMLGAGGLLELQCSARCAAPRQLRSNSNKQLDVSGKPVTSNSNPRPSVLTSTSGATPPTRPDTSTSSPPARRVRCDVVQQQSSSNARTGDGPR
jgi:hypothetical protein